MIYLAILAVCPLLSWGRTEGKQFWARPHPAVCAVVLFAVLMFTVTYLLPSYKHILAAGGTEADGLLGGSRPVVVLQRRGRSGLLVASLLFFNSLFMLGRAIAGTRRGHGGNVLASAWGMLVNRASTFGGFVAHLGMAVILVGLIGSSIT